MKKRLLCTLSLAALLISANSNAQIVHEAGIPVSWGMFKSATDEVVAVKMPSFDVEARLAEDAINDIEKLGPWRFGYEFETNYNTHNSGVWHDLDNGERIWRLAVNSTGALSMNVIFDTYNLVPGDRVFIYNEDRSDVIGPFTHLNNKEWNGLATLPISGETLIVELHQLSPAATNQSELSIGQVTHGYRDIFGYARRTYEKGLGDSGSCNNNVICPVGDPWRCEIASVAIIIANGSGACTGTVLNNLEEDERPLFLSANHCGTNVSNWVFRFNWESPSCNQNQNGPTNQTVSGASLLSASAGSDFSLMELSSNIPASYNVYYSGWDATGAAPQNSTGIHHPSGDVKKISFDTDPAMTANYGGAVCWNVQNWEDGTTEPGSSGSGLWDQNHRLVGQLFGGSASCFSITDDFYGKLSTSWNGGGTPGTRVRDYLDPNGTGVMFMDGKGTGLCAGATYDNDAGIQSIDGIGTTCGTSTITPSVTLKNHGNLTLTSVNIDYNFNSGASSGTIPWTGSLAPGATTTVNLPTFNVSPGTNTLNVSTDTPNATVDQDVSNDGSGETFQGFPNGVLVSIDIIQDEYGSETTWEILDGGNVLYSGGPFSDNNDGQLESADVCLNLDECYTFVIYDSYGDGICCDYGNGSYTVGNNGAVYASGGQFQDEESTNFCVTLSLDENSIHGVKVYPNPTNGVVTVDLSELNSTATELKVLNAMGSVVAEQTVGATVNQFDLTNEANGIYFVEVYTEAGKAVYKLNLSK